MKFEENLIEFIKKYEGLSKTESKLFGEVFTPQVLIEEMLDTLPADVWTNKDLKWLDPAVGIGNFPAAILNRLMKGLEEVIPVELERRKHILENMFYMGDISTKNLFLLYQLFDANNEFKLNVFRGDFLGDDFDKQMVEWGLDGFDLVVGNPPYNDSEGIKGGCKNLYQPFIEKSLNILKDNGILVFITPPGFYKTTDFDKPNNIFKRIISDFSLIYLDTTDIQKKFFSKVGTLICYYLIKKENYNSKTTIKNDNGKFDVDISKYNFIPRIVSTETYSILKKITNKGIRLDIYRDDKKKIKVSNFLTLSTLNHLNSNGFWNAFIGNDDNRARIIIKTINPDFLLKIINSKLYRFIFYTYRHDGAVYHNLLKGFKIPDILKEYSDQELYEYFNLTPEEIQLIEETIQEPTKKKKSKKK